MRLLYVHCLVFISYSCPCYFFKKKLIYRFVHILKVMDSESNHNVGSEFNPFDYAQPTPPAHATQSQGSPYHSTMAPPAAAQPKRKKVSSTKRGKKKVNTPPAMTSGAHRSKNYSREEDRALCSAYLNVCKDPSVGANQTIDTYWQRIHDYMYSHFSFEIERTPGSLAKRWEYIQRDVSRFCGCKNEQE